MTDLRKLQSAMLAGDLYGIAHELGYGIDRKPQCPICGHRIPQPHRHCDLCEVPYLLENCKAPGCRVIACPNCMPKHAGEHLYE